MICPGRNEADVEELPDHLRADMEFVTADTVDEVLDAALEAKPRKVRLARAGYSGAAA
jgi:ATP-dependent Lon protease